MTARTVRGMTTKNHLVRNPVMRIMNTSHPKAWSRAKFF
jgi:hypothetical protein